MHQIMRRIGKPVEARCLARTASAAAPMLAGLVALCSLFPVAHSQQQSQANALPRYTVELIVFTYSASDSAGSEIFVPDKPAPAPRADELADADSADQQMENPAISRQPEPTGPGTQRSDVLRELPTRERVQLQVLERDEYTLDDIYSHLARLDAYEPIMRTGWTQTTPEKAVAPAVHLRALADPPLGLDGSFTLYLGRFVHLSVDLALDADTERPAMNATDRLIAYGDDRMRNEEVDDFLPRPVRYRIVEDRIMRSGDIRYFDHPRFGVIAKVTKVEENGDSGDMSGSDEQNVAGRSQ